MGFSLPFGNAAYAPHMYSATMEAGGQYVPSSHYAAFQNMLTTDRAEADTLDAALLIGEWGSGISDDANLALFVGDILTTGMYAASLGDIGSRDVVAVVGAGPVGFFCVQAAWSLGAFVGTIAGGSPDGTPATGSSACGSASTAATSTGLNGPAAHRC